MSREEVRRILREQGRRLSELELELAQGKTYTPPQQTPTYIPLPEPPSFPEQLIIPLAILAIIIIYVITRFIMCFWQAILSVLGFSGLFAFLGFTLGSMISRRVRKATTCAVGIFSLVLLSYILSQNVVGNFIFQDAYITSSGWSSFYNVSIMMLAALVAFNVTIALVKRRRD